MNTEKISDSFNSIASRYDEQRRSLIPCYDDFYHAGISLLSECRNDFSSVIDLGAGTGLLTKFLMERFPSAYYTLVDISDQMLGIARIRFENLANVEFIVSDYSKSLPDRKGDLIASALSIHHLDSDSKAGLYSMIYRGLDDGGYFLNLDQFISGSGFIEERYNKWWYDFIEKSGVTGSDRELMLKRRELDRENTVDETKMLLRGAGFREVECVYSFMKFGVIIAVK